MSADENSDAPASPLAEIDAEIERLTTERAEYQSRLDDPVEKSRRRIRRQQILGVTAERWRLTEALIDEVRAQAGDDVWLFSPDLMRADGWVKTDEIWQGPREL